MNDTAGTYLMDIVSAQKRGRAVGLMSVCSANRFVIEAAMQQAAVDNTILLVESTANQVNQFGGYTGMTPKAFAAFVLNIARGMNFPGERILLGGDHLGPGPWQGEPAGRAMENANGLVRACIEAGYRKIHLDASMACLDDELSNGHHLPVDVAAQRSALLCRSAEDAADGADFNPVYVIGTDVPVPGGMRGKEKTAWVSRVSDVKSTIEETRKGFLLCGLGAAWERTLAIVVQPGVEFGPDHVSAYDRERSEKLISLIKSDGRFVFEAHATDYQSTEALRQLVEDRFAILKVGPSLTFAFREALTALWHIEVALFSGRRNISLSNLRKTIAHAMDEKPAYWKDFHREGEAGFDALRYYSYSDRVRYFWPLPEIQASIQRLIKNLDDCEIPLPLLSQYLPRQYEAIQKGRLAARPEAIIRNRIMDITSEYTAACNTAEDVL
jgi:D-tagatose-1,6-bisphosphate aldolase subunit GatZ/KbaZ